MFTGIVEEKGIAERIVKGAAGSIFVRAKKVLEGTKIGDSIAVNGVCLTVTSFTPGGFTADIMPETFRRSNLGRLRPGDSVNLERAMAAGGRFGGHIVSGHIDGTGTIRSVKKEKNATWVEIETPPALLRHMVEKGSVAIDGISLTIAAVTEDSFSVSLIPHTGSETTLLSKKAGKPVNLETDIIAKYVEKLLSAGLVPPCDKPADFPAATGFTASGDKPAATPKCESRVDEEFLRSCGFM